LSAPYIILASYAIFLPKIIQTDGNLTKTILQSFWDTVYSYKAGITVETMA